MQEFVSPILPIGPFCFVLRHACLDLELWHETQELAKKDCPCQKIAVRHVEMNTNTKTKEELQYDLQALQQKFEHLQENHAKRAEQENRLQKLTNDLSERLKELHCLHAIAKIRETPNKSLDNVLEEILELIPPAFQYPEIASAQLVFSEQQHATRNFCPTECGLKVDVPLNNGDRGFLELCYGNPLPESNQPLFLEEEKRLLEAIAEQIKTVLDLHVEIERAEQHQQQLVQLDKMVALGTLVSGVAHEINNPNNFIMLNTPILADAWKSILPILDDYQQEHGDFVAGGLMYSEIREHVDSLFAGIMGGANRIKNIVDGLKGFARAEASERSFGIDVNKTVQAALLLVNNQIKKATDHLHVSCQEKLPTLYANAQRLEQVWVNLLQNACECLLSRDKGIFVSTSYDSNHACVIVEVRDQGPGIPLDKLQKVMDPFFTTKRDSGGTGLGLSISSGIIKDHGGTLNLTSSPEGTTATVKIPVTEPKEMHKETGTCI